MAGADYTDKSRPGDRSGPVRSVPMKTRTMASTDAVNRKPCRICQSLRLLLLLSLLLAVQITFSQ